MSEDPGSTSAEIATLVEDRAWPRRLPGCRRLARRAAAAALEGAPEAAALGPRLALTVVLADDRLTRRLNRDFRGRDRATNVLAFADLEGPRPPSPAGTAPAVTPTVTPAVPGPALHLGNVVLARETLEREARDQGKRLADHLAHLVVHGVLHLIGYDHQDAAQRARMEAREIVILAALGIADPYGGSAAGAEAAP